MTTCEIKKISSTPPKYEAAIRMHHYTIGADAGWFRIEVMAMGRTESAARKSAERLLGMAQASCAVVSVELGRETQDATEG